MTIDHILINSSHFATKKPLMITIILIYHQPPPLNSCKEYNKFLQ